jgi:thiol-disulfide isomerase/thioredoxin
MIDMKSLFSILLPLFIVMFYSCSTSQDQYAIEIDLDGIEGKWVKLTGRDDGAYVVLDSVLAEAGSTPVLSQSVEGIQTMYLSVEGLQGSVRLLVENASYTISGSLEDPVIDTDSKAQSGLNNYNQLMAAIDDELSALVETYYEARDNGDQVSMDSIITLYNKVSERKSEADSLYLEEHPDSHASVLLLRSSFYTLDLNEFEEALARLDPALHQMDEFQYMQEILEKQLSTAVGQPYTDFSLETPQGEMLSVSDVHDGNVLLIDFWASWCGPCRRANPELVELYGEYSGQGFEILGVSLDMDTASWLKAIVDDNLTWPQMSDVKGWESAGAKLYGVPAIPHTVLVDRQGNIHARKLHGEELKNAIISLL